MALLLLSFPLLASAAPLPAPEAFGIYLNEVVLTTQGSQNWETILVAILLIILGIYTATLGGSGSYLAVYFNGFVSFSTLSTIITWNVEPSTGYSQRAALYLSIWMLTGFTGGLLYGFYPAAGHFLSNAVYGMCWGIQFICLSSGGIFTTTTGRQLFLIPFETIPLVLSFFYPRHTLSVSLHLQVHLSLSLVLICFCKLDC
ncbi:hypothetical protein BCR33DRAFT_785752 [Rhizoclosmatium globosum]|uniref:TM7S3/TM198-like domain-containing protein n=1 Tax=Rhizoclosmatium globosum TaxID=329046 RepID=A0A1Y2C8L7_9FUNG|nr:hypothetical protein BCR33DRAFT_785752 [Rhizoclosmatium globosum]|eukprot:ORY43381.1 hypothetical protein BCR33DRAFT_785752 [Rhizoclosmatium globosum]